MRKGLLSVLLLSSIMLCGCKNQIVKYEDTNGDDDFSLNTITQEMLISSSISSLSIGSIFQSTKTGFKSTCHEFHGIKDLYKTTIKEETTFNVSTAVLSGNLEFVILHNGEIYKEATLNVIESVTFPENFGKIVFRVAGENANYVIACEKGY